MIPERVLDKHLGILGTTGSGKTYTAKGAAEVLLDRGMRVCILDPTGVWHGLRSSANGRKAGYPVIVFGGPHADMQISGTHGDAIGEAVGTSSSSAIIDVSTMRGGERTKFFADFAETLRVKNSGPLNLFIDEAHLLMPQGRVADPQSANMLHAANNLMSLGRSRGLRITLISQRPAKIHKDSLSQVQALIAMRMIAPQDRAAVEAWIADQADPAEGKKIIASLPTLKTGEGWLWAPELSTLERVKFPKIKTFDSSRSPETGDGNSSIVLAPINLDAIQGKLASIKQEKIANDPIALKKQIADLERRLAAAPERAPTITDKDLRQAKIDGYADGVSDTADEIEQRLDKAFTAFRSAIVIDDKKIAEWKRRAARAQVPAPASTTVHPPATLAERRLPLHRTQETGSALTGPQRRIIDSLAFWKTTGHDTPSREQVAAVAGYSAGGGSFQNTLSQLRTLGMIEYRTGGTISLASDVFHLTASGEPLSVAEAAGMLKSILGGPHRKVIAALNHGAPMSREELAQASGYEAGGGSFQNTVSRLNVLGILTRPSAGMLALSDWAREILQ